jgi:AcrR family transcriptional regulator
MKFKNEKEKEIVKAAYEIFQINGYHNAKMKTIADKAGIGKGTLYEYFKSKKELFEISMIFSMEKGFEGIKEVLNLDLGFREKVIEYFKYKKNYMENQNTIFESFFSNRELISDKVRDTFFCSMKNHYYDIMVMVEEGVKEGVVREDVNKDILASCILSISNQHLGINSRGDKNPGVDFEKIIDSLLEGFGRR